MKKLKVKELAKETKKLKEIEESENDEEVEIASKLMNCSELNINDINKLAQKIISESNINYVLIIGNLDKFKERFSQIELNTKYDILIILELNKKDYSTICITNYLKNTYILYKNFLDDQIPENFKDIIENKFGKNLKFKINNQRINKDDVDNSNYLSLKTLEIIVENLKPDKKEDFVNKFSNNNNEYFSWIKNGLKNIKNWSFSYFKSFYFQKIASDIDYLANKENSEFRKELKKILDDIPLPENINYFQEYVSLLEECAKNDEISQEILEKVEISKKKAFGDTKKLTSNLSKHSEKSNGNINLTIMRKYPLQIQKLTKVFEPLCKSTFDIKLEKEIEKLCNKLELDHQKLKNFFILQDSKNNPQPIMNAQEPKAKAINIKNSKKPLKDDLEKSLKTILSEIILIDSNKFQENNFSTDIDKKILLYQNFHSIKKYYNEYWVNKNVEDIQLWAKNKKGNLESNDYNQAISIMDRANEIATDGHRLRDTQILAILIFLQNNDQGKICQIHTGEGKTTIISILAAIKCLSGQNVDIITSNPILALEAIRDKQVFYNILQIGISTNNCDDNYISGTRKCYKEDIVYGSIGNFQFDYLKDVFLGFKTRGGRSFGYLILDEVDSMIIDNSSHIAKLSGPLPGMENLRYIYIKIWQELINAENKLIKDNQEKLDKYIDELKLKLNSNTISKDNFEELMQIFLKNLIDLSENRIMEYIKASKPTEMNIIPSHIREYANLSLERLIKSAINAKFNYNEDEQYKIGKDKNGEDIIQPVDNLNTGITLKNTVWEHGLHQFLQLKHNLHLTAESLTCSYISNLGYINKYKDRMYGLTGTLGSNAEQELLSSIYNINYAKIPTFKQRRFNEIQGKVVEDKLFFQIILEDTLNQIKNNRACLIICEKIKEAKILKNLLLEIQYQNLTIKSFFDEDNAHVTEEEIDSGHVVIATNIAGRGTDFKTSSKLKINGGLHVIISFLPCNKRVEDQAFGRTSRQGDMGTAQIIIRKRDIESFNINIEEDDFENIKRYRDSLEIERLNFIKNIKIKELNYQDELFGYFCEFYIHLIRNDKSNGEFQYVLDDLKEYWSFWLEKKNFNLNSTNIENASKNFEQFKLEVMKNVSHDNSKPESNIYAIQFNSYYSIQQAEHFINNEKIELAEKALNNAINISLNPQMLYSAYLKLFEVSIEKGNIYYDKIKKAIGDTFTFGMAGNPDRNYKINANMYLNKANESLTIELDYIEKLFNTEEFKHIAYLNNCNFEDKNEPHNMYSEYNMKIIGESILENIDVVVQFKNILIKSQIENLCKNQILNENLPIYICYITEEHNGEEHWLAMTLIKHNKKIKIFYKDPLNGYDQIADEVKNEFQKYFKDLEFLVHSTDQKICYKESGALTLKFLEIIKNIIEEKGIDYLSENYTSINSFENLDSNFLRNDYKILIKIKEDELNMSKNYFDKHFKSRYNVLKLCQKNIIDLIDQIKKIDGGITINKRITDLFLINIPKTEVEIEIKNKICDSELYELQAIGANVTYSINEVHDVKPEIVQLAQIQIIGGISLLCVSLFFPPAIIVTSFIGGTMISEGICDIVLDLFSNEKDFKKEAYIKGKVISYAISLVTLGIQSYPRILKCARNACRSLSNWVRKLDYFKSICEFLADKIDLLGNYFDKLYTIAKYNNFNNIQKIEYIKKLQISNKLNKLEYLNVFKVQYNILSSELKLFGTIKEVSNSEKLISELTKGFMNSAKYNFNNRIQGKMIDILTKKAAKYLLDWIKHKIQKSVSDYIFNNINRDSLAIYSIKELKFEIKNYYIDLLKIDQFVNKVLKSVLNLFKIPNWQINIYTMCLEDILLIVHSDNVKIICNKINNNPIPFEKTINNINENINFISYEISMIEKNLIEDRVKNYLKYALNYSFKIKKF